MDKLKIVAIIALMFLFLSIEKGVFAGAKQGFSGYYEVYNKETANNLSKGERVLDEDLITFYFELLNPSRNCQIFLEASTSKFAFNDIFLFDKLINVFYYFNDEKYYKNENQVVKWYFCTHCINGYNATQYGLEFKFPRRKIPEKIVMQWTVSREDFIKLMNYNGDCYILRSKSILNEVGKVKEDVLYLTDEIIIDAVAYNNGKEVGRIFLPLQDIDFYWWHQKRGDPPKLMTITK